VTIAELGERGLLARLRERVAAAPRPHATDWLLIGIGDDAAVLAPERGMADVLTTDALVEDIHFRRGWSSPSDIGHRALAVNLSDLAAMGASPRAVLLSLAMPSSLPIEEFDGMLDGFLGLAAQARAPLVGGNITRSPGPVVIDVTALGSVHPRRVLRRSGARPGDRVFVTGQLGAAAAGLALRASGVLVSALDADQQSCVRRYDRPDARLRTGVIVARNKAASACMDLSDGLADAVVQVAAASGCGIELSAGEVPVHPGVRNGLPGFTRAPLDLALAGGDDYELLFTVPRRRMKAFLAAVHQAGETSVTPIGICVKASGAWLLDGSGRKPVGPGFGHFS